MILFLLKLLLISFITEAITEIIVVRDIFKPIRDKIKEDSFIKKMISCGACTSVWVAIILSYLFDLRYNFIDSLYILEPLILAFAVHRLATYWHQIYGAFKFGPKINKNNVNLNQNVDINQNGADNS